jgi:hypothetical protein
VSQGSSLPYHTAEDGESDPPLHAPQLARCSVSLFLSSLRSFTHIMLAATSFPCHLFPFAAISIVNE